MVDGGGDHDPGDPRDETAELNDHEYFQAIEEVFVRLRGAPLLLSPKDWQTARTWHREGIPLGLVLRTLEEVFEGRRERGDQDKISSLRYCSRAVRAAWTEIRELTAVADRPEGSESEERTVPAVAERLEALAQSLPKALPGRGEVRDRLSDLGRPEGGEREADERRVEEALAALDGEVVMRLIEGLGAERRRSLDEEVERSLETLAERVPLEELGRARERLLAQKVRRMYGLPTLSLFAPEAEPRVGDEPE